jgi:outer membrane protein OmpA-like peptidoglycan-associated protein
MLFGETIAWLRPNSPLFRPEPPSEPEPVLSPTEEPTAEGPVADVIAPAPGEPSTEPSAEPSADVTTGEPEPAPSKRTRALLVVAGVLAVVLIGVIAFVLFGGGSDHGASTASAPASASAPTTGPSRTTPPSTIPPSQGQEKTTPQGTSVTVNADVLFDVGSSSLTPEASSRLGAFLTLAGRDPTRHLLVEGFTDSDGGAAFNQQLSEQRAQSVAQWLTGQGIDPARINSVGHGADSPVAPNDTPEHKALNRRVVVTLLNASG